MSKQEYELLARDSIGNNDAGNTTVGGKIQKYQAYRKMEDMNAQANEICVKCCKICAKLPETCQDGLQIISIIMTFVMFVAYIVGIGWVMLYSFYTFKYESNGNSFVTTIVLRTDDPVKALYNSDFCDFYGIDCFKDYSSHNKDVFGECYDDTGLQYKTFDYNQFESQYCGCQCTNTCRTANNGICDDTTICPYGTDCNDCGSRGNCTLCGHNSPNVAVQDRTINLDGLYIQTHYNEREWHQQNYYYNLYLSFNIDDWSQGSQYPDWYLFYQNRTDKIGYYNGINFFNSNPDWFISDNNSFSNNNSLYYTLSDCNQSFVPKAEPNANGDITELTDWQQFWIKAQLCVSYFFWAKIKYQMSFMETLSWQYALFFIANNIMSYIFRHIGFIYYKQNDLIVLYSPYFTQAFLESIVTYIIAFIFWVILSFVCLKKERSNNRKRLRLRCCGRYNAEMDRIDTKSVFTNILVWLFLGYASMVSCLWIGIESSFNDAIKIINNDSGPSIDGFIGFIELFLTTIVKYFTPKIYWYMPFTLAALCCNISTLTEILIFIMKFIAETAEKIKKMDDNRPKSIKKIKDVKQKKNNSNNNV